MKTLSYSYYLSPELVASRGLITMTPLQAIETMGMTFPDLGPRIGAKVDLVWRVSGYLNDCPECGNNFSSDGYNQDSWEYCPYCGLDLHVDYENTYATEVEAKKDKHALDFGIKELFKYTVYRIEESRPDLVLEAHA